MPHSEAVQTNTNISSLRSSTIFSNPLYGGDARNKSNAHPQYSDVSPSTYATPKPQVAPNVPLFYNPLYLTQGHYDTILPNYSSVNYNDVGRSSQNGSVYSPLTLPGVPGSTSYSRLEGRSYEDRGEHIYDSALRNQVYDNIKYLFLFIYLFIYFLIYPEILQTNKQTNKQTAE